MILANEDEPIEDWLDRMREFGEFGDEYCLQIFSNLINLIHKQKQAINL